MPLFVLQKERKIGIFIVYLEFSSKTLKNMLYLNKRKKKN